LGAEQVRERDQKPDHADDDYRVDDERGVVAEH
jgi:hypothetical protein